VPYIQVLTTRRIKPKQNLLLTINTLIAIANDNKNVLYASKVLDALLCTKGKNIVSTIMCTRLIQVFEQHNKMHESLSLMRFMVERDIPLDAITYTVLLKACAEDIFCGKQLHSFILNKGVAWTPQMVMYLIM
jgi:hypothetical protein